MMLVLVRHHPPALLPPLQGQRLNDALCRSSPSPSLHLLWDDLPKQKDVGSSDVRILQKLEGGKVEGRMDGSSVASEHKAPTAKCGCGMQDVGVA